MKKTYISSIISIIIICAITINSSPIKATTSPINNEKIAEELLEIIDSSKATDIIPVTIWFNEIDTEKIQNDVKTVVKINKESFSDSFSTESSKKIKNTYTHDQVDEYIETERELYSKEQAEKHNAFIKKHEWLQSNKKDSDENKIIFVSKYAPMMIAELTANEILNLSKDTSVERIYYSPNKKGEDLSSVANSVTCADYVRDNLVCTGSGIKIGMIEIYLPDPTSQNLTGKNIIYNPNDTRLYSDHATLVASILIGNSVTVDGITYQSIVPDATLYATCYYNSNEWYEQVEWLLSQGVNVINMSAGYYRDVADYDESEEWLDHIAINHSVHFVIAAGNGGSADYSGSIISPALAYNAITVGNVDDNNTVAVNDDALASNSCYVENNGTNKPDLVAPGQNIRYGNISDCGTSFATPQVTGIVAQLCQLHPSLKTKQDAMKAILTAAMINHPLIFTPTDDEYDKYGAGMVNAVADYYTVSSQYISSSFAANTAQTTSHYYNLEVYQTGSKMRVSLNWLKYNLLSGTHATNPTENTGTLANLTLRIYDPNGNFVMLSAESTSNTEILEFWPGMMGTYQMVVTVTSPSNRAIYYALSWY